MIRAVIAGGLIVAVLAGGFVYGAIRTITDETWPDF